MMLTKSLQDLLDKYPHWIPIKEAAPLLGVSPRQLAKLVTAGREPFGSLGSDIGIGDQHYCRIYTGRLVRYLSGENEKS